MGLGDGHIDGFEDFVATNDEAALTFARGKLDGHPLELWEDHRKVLHFILDQARTTSRRCGRSGERLRLLLNLHRLTKWHGQSNPIRLVHNHDPATEAETSFRELVG
jgi:hypothetical protein